jgi:peroxiredoxin
VNHGWGYQLIACIALFQATITMAAGAQLQPTLEASDLLTGKAMKIGIDAGKKGLVVVFLSSRCPCSTSHEPVLSKLLREFPEFAFVGVNSNSDEDIESAQKHFRASGLPFPVLSDRGAALANRFQALKTPHAYVLNPSGEVLFQGGVDSSREAANAEHHYLADALTAIRQGKKPDPQEVRTLGCIIKR